MSSDKILKFANRHGFLGKGLVLIDPTIPLEEHGFLGESLDYWRRRIHEMSYLVDLWKLIQVGDTKKLSAFVKWKGSEQVRMVLGARDGLQDERLTRLMRDGYKKPAHPIGGMADEASVPRSELAEALGASSERVYEGRVLRLASLPSSGDGKVRTVAVSLTEDGQARVLLTMPLPDDGQDRTLLALSLPEDGKIQTRLTLPPSAGGGIPQITIGDRLLASADPPLRTDLLARWRPGDPLEPAKYYLAERINEHLAKEVIGVDPFSDLQFRFRPTSLLNLLYTLLAIDVSGGEADSLRECDRAGCSNLFRPTNTRQRFCGGLCRSKAGYHSRKGTTATAIEDRSITPPLTPPP